MARRLLDHPGLDDAGRIRQAYLTAYGRPPTDREIARASDYLRRFASILESQGVGPESRSLRVLAGTLPGDHRLQRVHLSQLNEEVRFGMNAHWNGTAGCVFRGGSYCGVAGVVSPRWRWPGFWPRSRGRRRRSSPSTGLAAAAFPRQGQARHLLVYAWRSVAGRHVRL